MSSVHVLTVKDGLIEIRFAPLDRLETYIHEDDAAWALADEIYLTDIADVIHSTSNALLKQEGRPDFDYVKFRQKVIAFLKRREPENSTA